LPPDIADASHAAFAGVARVLVQAGKLTAKTADELQKTAREKRSSFVSALVEAAALPAGDLAHALSAALAVPLLDLNAVDPQRLPQNLIDAKLAAQYRIVALGKRGNRLFIGGIDPTDQEAAERIKFATQQTPEWVIVEYDKIGRFTEAGNTTATEALEQITSGDFEFDVTDEVAKDEAQSVSSDVEDAPVVRFLQKMLIDAINLRASDLHFEPYEFTYRVRFRVDGELREITTPPLAIKDKLSARIKVLSRLDIAERRVPRTGG
jgi:type IV pilus assembly protein PilB